MDYFIVSQGSTSTNSLDADCAELRFLEEIHLSGATFLKPRILTTDLVILSCNEDIVWNKSCRYIGTST